MKTTDFCKGFFLSVLIVLLLLPSLCYGAEKKKVLVLHSYHPGFHWTDSAMQGIKSVLGKEDNVELFVTYMDTKKRADSEYFLQLRNLYAQRYIAFKFDAILTTDDHALNFLLKYRDGLFPGVPVFFSGINDYTPARIEGKKLFSGVYAVYDASITLDFILEMHPKTKSVVVVSDSSNSGDDFRGLVERVEPQYRDKLRFNYFHGLSLTALKTNLNKLPPDAVVIWAIYMRTPEGEPLSSQESVKIVTENSPVPTYCMWDVVGQGVVGGSITSPRFQGQSSSTMALEYLNGKRFDEIPVTKISTIPKFDYNAMKRFNMTERQLPAHHVLINKPFSFYEEYKFQILLTALFIVILVILIIFLLVNIFYRRKSENQFKAMVETSPLAIYMSKGREIKSFYLNPTFVKFFGYTINDVPTAEDFWILAYPNLEYREKVREEWKIKREIINQKDSETKPLETNVICKDGSTKSISWGHVSVGKLNWAYGIDITERKKMTDELEQLNKSLEERVQEKTYSLKAANKELESFSYSVSHDLRAPLRAINGFTDILIEDFSGLPEDVEGYLKRIHSSAQKMDRLINSLLDFGRMGRKELQKTNVDVSKIVTQCIEELCDTEETRQIEFKVSDIPVLQGDHALLKQVMLNLISNAIKYSRNQERSVVEIGHTIESDKVVVFVRDNGVGFDMHYKDKLFGVFQRLHSEEAFEGTGVGLALSKRIVERHGGRIWAEAEVNKGATFYFTITPSR